MVRFVLLAGVAAVALLLAACETGAPVSRDVGAVLGGPAGPGLTLVAEFPDRQVTGVAVSATGRVFVCAPRWSSNRGPAGVAEVRPDGRIVPFPDAQTNQWQPGADPTTHFVCIQSVVVDDRDHLWVLDPAAPDMGEVVPTGPKLVEYDLADNRLLQRYPLGPAVGAGKAYLNDVRIDTQRGFAYLTESGEGSLVVLNLRTGEARRVLQGHPSAKAEPNVDITINGRPVRGPDGRTPQVHADGIALSPDGDTLYYHALTGRTLYRIPTAALRDFTLSDADLARAAQPVAETVVTDGLLCDPEGRVYHTALERNAIISFDPSGRLREVIRDDRLLWPDSLALGPDGALYVTTSQIHLTPRFHEGQDARTQPQRLFKTGSR